MVLQNGANSAVGRYVIQMCREMGVRTINIVRDRPHFEDLERELRTLGATTVVKSSLFPLQETQRYLCESLNLARPRLALNCVGGALLHSMTLFIANGAAVVTYGGMARKNPIISASSLIFRDIHYHGFWMSRWYDHAPRSQYQAMMDDIISMFQRGTLLVPKMMEFPFAAAWDQAILKYSGASIDTPGVTSDAKPLLIISTPPRENVPEAIHPPESTKPQQPE